MERVLLVGDDAHLLAARAANLAQIGAAATCCAPSTITEDVEWKDFDRVVLCHAIEWQGDFLSLTRAVWDAQQPAHAAVQFPYM